MLGLLVTLSILASGPSGSTPAVVEPSPPPPIMLAVDHVAHCRVVMALHPTEGEARAAAVLRDNLRRMSPADIAQVTADQPGEGVRLLVGSAAAVMLGGELAARNLGPDGFLLRTSPTRDAIAIAGANDDSTLAAVYAFLEVLGCRWYMPGKIGEVVPFGSNLVCPVLERTEIPDFYHRVLWNNGWVAPTLTEQSKAEYAEWCRRNRLGGLPADHGHAWDRIVPEDHYFANHPDYFSLLRAADGSATRRRGRQLCTSSPDVIAIAAQAANDFFAGNPTSLCFSLSPNDRGGWCECDACRALGGPGANGLSDRVLQFVNAVAERTDAEHPGRLIAYYALYGNLPGPPTTIRPRANVMPVMVNTACHLHAITDPQCPVNSRWREQVGKWHGMSKQLFAYDYFQYSDLPTPINHLIGRNIRFYRDIGCLGFSGEILGRSQVNNVALYLAARMLWDADQDPNALLDEFCERYYGHRAGQWMRQYYETLEDAARRERDHGMAFTPAMYTPDLLARLNGLLERAAGETSGGVIHRRVEMAQLDFRATMLIVEGLRAHETWAADPTPAGQQAALSAIGGAAEFLKSIAAQDIVAEDILLRRLGELRTGVEQGRAVPLKSARNQPGYDDQATFGDLWAKYEDLGSLPTQGWLFHIDARKEGEDKGWYLPTFDDSRWTLIDIGEWWEPQRGDHDGVAWYRRQIDLPPSVAGRRCVLWFGAVDESAWVYLDGRLIGQHDVGETGWDQRFSIDLPAGVTPGQHLLAVKVLDRALMGGIWKPIKLACYR